MSAPTPPDPYRIKRILNKLERVWETMPEEAFLRSLGRTMWSSEIDSYTSDEILESELDTYLKDHSMSQWKS